MNELSTSATHQTHYVDMCSAASHDDEIFKNFRQSPTLIQMLEHVSVPHGQDYYDYVHEYYPQTTEKINLCVENDVQGTPSLHNYSFGVFSPTTLRYFKVISDINHCFNNIEKMNILEIGGGYGGQCLVASQMFGFNSWTIVDLPEVNQLQERYLKGVQQDINLLSCFDYENTKQYDLIISNYAFSECIRSYQDKYIEHFMSHDEKIYMTLNFVSPNTPEFIDVYSRPEIIEKLSLESYSEKPNTHVDNIVVLRNSDRKLPHEN